MKHRICFWLEPTKKLTLFLLVILAPPVKEHILCITRAFVWPPKLILHPLETPAWVPTCSNCEIPLLSPGFVVYKLGDCKNRISLIPLVNCALLKTVLISRTFQYSYLVSLMDIFRGNSQFVDKGSQVLYREKGRPLIRCWYELEHGFSKQKKVAGQPFGFDAVPTVPLS